MSLLIANARIVNEGHIIEGDVLIEQGRITAVGSGFPTAATSVLDAAGRYLLPGLIDDQVHFREPGLTHKGDLASESRAAVAGGITSFMDMPNTEPATLGLTDIQAKKQAAAGRAFANYGFYLGASNDNLEAVKALNPHEACGINLFIGSSCTHRLVDDPDMLENIFMAAPVLVTAHCEDTPTIIENEESYRSIYGDAVPFELHPLIRSEEACLIACEQALAAAERCQARLHVLHLSTAREVELFTKVALADKRITAEVCAHYLHFSDEDYAQKGALIKCNPAIKSPEDRAALMQGLLEGRVDMISSGHAPHRFADKQGNHYFKTPSGMPLVQDALLSLLEHYHDGIFPLELLVEKTSHAVARLFDVQGRGFIREGYWADLVLVDLAKPHTASHAGVLAQCGWTPYDGYTFRSSIAATLVNGQIAWFDGQLQALAAPGLALAFDR